MSNQTVREILESDEMNRLRYLAGEVGENTAEAVEDLKRMSGLLSPDRERPAITVLVNPESFRTMDRWARHWRVSRTALVRLCMHFTADVLGFETAGLLTRNDEKALRRHRKSRGPYDTQEETEMKIRTGKKGRLFRFEQRPRYRAARRHDAPQSRPVHGHGPGEPAGANGD